MLIGIPVRRVRIKGQEKHQRYNRENSTNPDGSWAYKWLNRFDNQVWKN